MLTKDSLRMRGGCSMQTSQGVIREEFSPHARRLIDVQILSRDAIMVLSACAEVVLWMSDVSNYARSSLRICGG